MGTYSLYRTETLLLHTLHFNVVEVARTFRQNGVIFGSIDNFCDSRCQLFTKIEMIFHNRDLQSDCLLNHGGEAQKLETIQSVTCLMIGVY